VRFCRDRGLYLGTRACSWDPLSSVPFMGDWLSDSSSMYLQDSDSSDSSSDSSDRETHLDILNELGVRTAHLFFLLSSSNQFRRVPTPRRFLLIGLEKAGNRSRDRNRG
jgi:hypothetical protein